MSLRRIQLLEDELQTFLARFLTFLFSPYNNTLSAQTRADVEDFADKDTQDVNNQFG